MRVDDNGTDTTRLDYAAVDVYDRRTVQDRGRADVQTTTDANHQVKPFIVTAERHFSAFFRGCCLHFEHLR